jgi:hypothetical protein
VRRWGPIIIAAGLAIAACGGDDDDDPAKQSLAPQFLPEAGADADGGSGGSTKPGAPATTTSLRPSAAGRASVTTTTAAAVVADGTTTVPAGVAPSQASISDAAGDLTPSPLDRPPAWADLLAARLVRTSEGFELRVRLNGGAAPQRTADAEHTMNIASFYDIDGDGRIDTEVWLNVASGGWGATWFDNVGDGGGFQDGSGVTVAPEGDEVVARFPLTHLSGAERFRWAIASEWGRYETIGTVAAARDDLPDDDNIARFPGA